MQRLQINFKNIRVDPYTILNKCAVRKVYMEYWKDLTEEEKQDIEDLQIGVTGTLMVSCEAKVHYVKHKRGKHL